MKNALILLIVSGFLIASENSFAIKKCQDADGKWHYGDRAVEECENSKITTLTDRGFIKEEEAAPKTEAELQAEAEEQALLEKEREEKLAAEEEKRRILSIYETEADIDRQRDNQVRSVQSNIDVHESYLANMEKRIARFEQKKAAATNANIKDQIQSQIDESKVRMEEYSANLKTLEQQRQDIMDRFKKERETYLALKNGSE